MQKFHFHTISALFFLFSVFAIAETHFFAPPDGSTLQQLWNMEDAWKQTTETRETICLNGLWQAFPVLEQKDAVTIPDASRPWGYFKVPGIWPRNFRDFFQPGESNKFYLPDKFPSFDQETLNAVWYKRKIQIPDDWNAKQIILELNMLQTSALCLVNGQRVGELFFPGGRLDLSTILLPGKSYDLALLVVAKQDNLATVAFNAPGRITKIEAKIKNRGLAGDIFLSAEPKSNAISDVHVITSFRKKQISFDTGIRNPEPGNYVMKAVIRDGTSAVQEFQSDSLTISNKTPRCRLTFTADWIAPKLWDTDTPENLYTAEISLYRNDGTLVDTFFPQTFGFREFWCEGRNFMLNGSVIHLRSMYAANVQDGAARSCRATSKRTALRVKACGFNHLIAYDYAFNPGIVGYIEDFYKGCSEAGVLTSLTMPHVKDFDWNLENPVQKNRYLEWSEYLIRRLQNVPGIVLLAANHNAAGYKGDQNPLKMDGKYTPDLLLKNDPSSIFRENFLHRYQAALSGKLIATLDSTRPVYHHESGNLGDLFTVNCYLNWVPPQERSDWLKNWENTGVKPMFFTEWGIPHIASWSSYRGPWFLWSATVNQCSWLNEYNAAFLGEEAYKSDNGKEAFYRKQEQLLTGNRQVHYDQIKPAWSGDLDLVRAYFADYNFRDIRGRGLSCFLPWDQDYLWFEKKKATIQEWPERFSNLKRPGIVPDFTRPGKAFVSDVDTEYVPSRSGHVALPWLREQIAWIGGTPENFTERSSIFTPGETVSKSLVLVNDSRHKNSVLCQWEIPELGIKEKIEVQIDPGDCHKAPISFQIPDTFSKNSLTIKTVATFSSGQKREDSLQLKIVHPVDIKLPHILGVYDPLGKSNDILDVLQLDYKKVSSQEDLTDVELLIIGREALTSPALSLSEFLANGGRLLVLEQTFTTLARLGFRSNEYGIRNFFPLINDFCNEPIKNWRGSSTLTPAFLNTESLEHVNPTWNWHGFSNTRAWRSENTGNVASVLLEKPSVGNFLPLAQGGFDLQYTPALEYINEKTAIIFSQFDLSSRTALEPQSLLLLKKMLQRLDSIQLPDPISTWYSGNQDTLALLNELKISFQTVSDCPKNGLLIIGSGTPLSNITPAVERGMKVLCLGLSQDEFDRLFPNQFETTHGRYYSDFVTGLDSNPEFLGISNADLHWRKELEFYAFPPSSTGGRALHKSTIGNGTIIALQVLPTDFDINEFQFRTSRRRSLYLLSRLLHNLGASDAFPLLSIFDPENSPITMELPLGGKWAGHPDSQQQGRNFGWERPDFHPDNSWRPTLVPGRFDEQFEDLADYNGHFWYRKQFKLSQQPLPDSRVILTLGPIDDESWVWINGKFLGELSTKTHPKGYWITPRIYTLTGKDLKQGINTIAVLCNDCSGTGGFTETPVLRIEPPMPFYADSPISNDDPYRYFRW